MLMLDHLQEVLSDGEKWEHDDLIKQTGYKNKRSLWEAIYKLRKRGCIIRLYGHGYRNKGKGYQMVINDYSDRWACMIPKIAWPQCFGHGCRHRDKCEAVIRR